MEIDAAIGGEPSAIHSDAKTSVQRLEARCDRLSLLCEALWTMVRDYGGFKEEELLERINLIDLEDGKLDGKKKTAGPRNCPKCSKAVSPRFHKCMFCSTPIQRDPFQ
jgi:hypothetical protein